MNLQERQRRITEGNIRKSLTVEEIIDVPEEEYVSNIEKSREGNYMNTSENRSKHRVGVHYGKTEYQPWSQRSGQWLANRALEKSGSIDGARSAIDHFFSEKMITWEQKGKAEAFLIAKEGADKQYELTIPRKIDTHIQHSSTNYEIINPDFSYNLGWLDADVKSGGFSIRTASDYDKRKFGADFRIARPYTDELKKVDDDKGGFKWNQNTLFWSRPAKIENGWVKIMDADTEKYKPFKKVKNIKMHKDHWGSTYSQDSYTDIDRALSGKLDEQAKEIEGKVEADQAMPKAHDIDKATKIGDSQIIMGKAANGMWGVVMTNPIMGYHSLDKEQAQMQYDIFVRQAISKMSDEDVDKGEEEDLLRKAFGDEFIEKGKKMPIGTISSSGKFKKVAEGKWMPNTKGVSQAERQSVGREVTKVLMSEGGSDSRKQGTALARSLMTTDPKDHSKHLEGIKKNVINGKYDAKEVMGGLKAVYVQLHQQNADLDQGRQVSNNKDKIKEMNKLAQNRINAAIMSINSAANKAPKFNKDGKWHKDFMDNAKKKDGERRSEPANLALVDNYKHLVSQLPKKEQVPHKAALESKNFALIKDNYKHLVGQLPKKQRVPHDAALQNLK